MTESHLPDDLTFYSISKQKPSIPDPGLILSAFADYANDCRKQIHFWQNRVKLLLKVIFTLKENVADAKKQIDFLQNLVKVLLEEKFTLNEHLDDAQNQIEDLTRQLAYINREFANYKCEVHPESLNGESRADWDNYRYR